MPLLIMERRLAPLLFSVFLLFSALHPSAEQAEAQRAPASFHVGVVLDFETLVGKMSRTSISLAMDDFYAAHANYTARLVLHMRDSNKDVVGAASEALDLLKNVQVQAIIGPLTSSQADFVVNLGSKSHVPIVSFSATSPSLSPARSPYFIRASFTDSSQVNCIASLLDLFGWKQVAPIYEDTSYGTGIVPYLVDALQEINTRIPYRSVIQTSATDDQIREELYKLKTMATRVFVVHMSSALGARLFLHANEVGMMEEGYVWIITDGLTNLLDSMDPSVLDSMQGVLGVKPYVPRSTQLARFTPRWRARFRRENPEIGAAEPSLFSLWAYDAVWALAQAAETVQIPNPNFRVIENKNNSTDLGSLRVSQTGPRLQRAIRNTTFRGLGGDFLLVDGQLRPSEFQIVNVNGRGGREVAFWTPAMGISRKLNSRTNSTQAPSPRDLGPVISPGEARVVPKGWEMPTGGKKMRVGVPVKDGFNEFVKVHGRTNRSSVKGYCIDVFDEVMKRLPYAVPYEYVPFANETGQSAGSYDDLVRQVSAQVFPKGSPLVPDVSRAILNVTEGESMRMIKKKVVQRASHLPGPRE